MRSITKLGKILELKMVQYSILHQGPAQPWLVSLSSTCAGSEGQLHRLCQEREVARTGHSFVGLQADLTMQHMPQQAIVIASLSDPRTVLRLCLQRETQWVLSVCDCMCRA